MILTGDQVLAFLAAFIEQQIKVASVNPNSILFDSFVDRLQERITELYADLTTVKLEESIANASSITSEALDRLGYDWNVTRKVAVPATGYVIFSSLTAPAATIRIGNADGSGGVTVQSRRRGDGSVVSYITTSTVFLLNTTLVDATTGKYSVQAPIEAISTGPSGNASAEEIVVLQANIPGVDEVINTTALSNGTAEEDNTDYARRIAAKVLGLHSGLEYGLISVGLGTDRVIDAVVSGPNDSDFVRDRDGGEVDLILLGEDVASKQESITKVASVSEYTLTSRPVLAIDGVQATVGLTNTLLTPDIDYEFVQDTTSTTAYSNTSADKVKFKFGGRSPNDRVAFLVNYRYDQLVSTVQAKITADSAQFITASPLAKRAKQSLVDIEVSVTKTASADAEAVKAQVETAISEFVDSLGLGEKLEQSDLTFEIKKNSLVDNVTLPFTKLVREGGLGTSDLTASRYEYFRINPLGLVVTVS